jgi:hypothetical protein
MSLIYFAELAKSREQARGRSETVCRCGGDMQSRWHHAFPLERATLDRNVAELRTKLLEGSFNAAWAEGRAMTLEQAVAYALADRI